MKNNVDSNINEQPSHTSQRQHKHNHHQQQNRQIKHEQTSSHEITVISGVHKYDNHPQQQQQLQQSNGYGSKIFSPPYQSGGLTDSTNSGYGKQLPQSPSKAYSFALLNQSNGSINNQSPRSMINANTKRNDYNRH